jgi:dephospho-CoA kinase
VTPRPPVPALRRRVPGPDDGLYVVGVTGGVASGKSTLVALLRSAGGPGTFVLDADKLGHAILARPAIARALAEAFGQDILDPGTGLVRRDVLGPRAFADPASLARLDAIVQPPLVSELDTILAAHAKAPGGRLVVLDAALLVEWDAGDRCDEIVAVIATPEAQVERLVRARGKSVEEARAIVARQLPAAARAAYADHVLENDGTIEEFLARARDTTAAIRARADGALARRGRTLHGAAESRPAASGE